MRPTSGESRKIQALRGLAILCVVFIHNTPQGLAQIWLRPLYNYAVAPFLFLSGLLTSGRGGKARRRIAKVGVPYLIWTLVYVLRNDLVKTFDPSSVPLDYVRGVLAGDSSGIMYYLFVYVELTLLVPVLDRLARSPLRVVGLLVSPTELVVCRTLPLVAGVDLGPVAGWVIRFSCLGWLSYYYLGYLLGNGLMRLRVTTKTLSCALVLGMACQVAEGYLLARLGKPNSGAQTRVSCMLSCMAYVLLAYRYLKDPKRPAPPVLAALGDASFGIYLAHPAVMSVLVRLPRNAFAASYPASAVVTLALTYAVVVALRRLLGGRAHLLGL